jgi:hypothetical protein
LSATQTLSDAGWSASHPGVGVDQNGNAVISWARGDGTYCFGHPCYRIQTRTRSAAGALGVTQTVSGSGADAYYPEVAVNALGRAALVWQLYDGMFYVGRVQASVGP